MFILHNNAFMKISGLKGDQKLTYFRDSLEYVVNILSTNLDNISHFSI